MRRFLPTILFDLAADLTRKHGFHAEAFEAPPTNPAARRYRAIWLGLFLGGAALLLAAALFETVAGDRPLSELFGWSGLAALAAAVANGFAYAAVNKSAKPDDWDWI